VSYDVVDVEVGLVFTSDELVDAICGYRTLDQKWRELWVRGQDWRTARQSFRVTSAAGMGLDLLVAPPLFRPDGRVTETVQECLVDLFAGGVTRDELDFAFTTATSRATQSVMDERWPAVVYR
jgi:hypothetical protein